MVNHDVYAAIAALLHPLPHAPTPQEAEEAGAPYEMWKEGHSAVLSQIAELRTRATEELRLEAEVSDEPLDPLLIALAQQRRDKERAEERIRALIAYGREFTEPRPHRLSDLASAAGMSVSGARTAYNPHTVAAVAQDTGINPRADTGAPPTPTRAETPDTDGPDNNTTDPAAPLDQPGPAGRQ